MRRFLRGVVGPQILVGAAVAGLALAQPAKPVKPGPAKPATPPVAPPPAAVIPTELSAAPPWIGRVFDTGLIVQRHRHETHTLRRHGVQALLTIESQIAGNNLMEIGPWQPQPVKAYLGTAEDKDKVVTLKLTNVTDPTDTISMPCRKTTIAAARPDAVRRSSAGASECGDTGRWHPRTTKKLTVLRCLPFDAKPMNLDDDTTWDSAPHLAFAPSPGIEWLYVNDDCLQGGGWRQVPANRSIVSKVR